MKNRVMKFFMLLSFAFVVVGGITVGQGDHNPIKTLDFPDQH